MLVPQDPDEPRWPDDDFRGGLPEVPFLRYEPVDHAMMEWIALGTFAPAREVDALLSAMRIAVIASDR